MKRLVILLIVLAICASLRIWLIAHADVIVVLDQGRIVERGTHDELLAKGGKYKYLYDIQFANA